MNMADSKQQAPISEAGASAPQRDFHHPYTPYPIQLDFMNALYDVLEDGCIGIFESPTGTDLVMISDAKLISWDVRKGKSLSLICGSLTWLRDHKRRKLNDELEKDVDDGSTPDWVLAHARKERRETALRARREMEARLQKVREKEEKERKQYMRKMNEQQQIKLYGGKRQKPEGSHKTPDETAILETEFELDDYQSDEDKSDPAFAGFSRETVELMKKAGYGQSKSKANEEEVLDEIKIFYCSRTHSQLSQFTAELRRVHLPPTYDFDEDSQDASNDSEKPEEVVKHLSLGSRKLLCINDKVNTPSTSANTVNDRCLDLQQSSTPAEKKCPFLLSKADNERAVLEREFRDLALADIKDIEDLRGVGEKLKICGYYASREAIKPTEIVTLPYPLLLQKSSREALKISVKNHVIIIDEAHNLMDAVANIHSVSISLAQLTKCADNLAAYIMKFGKRLKGGNRVYVAQCHRMVNALKNWLEKRYDLEPQDRTTKTPSKISDGIVTQGELLRTKGIDMINIFKLGKYLEESKLPRKVEGYTVFTENEKLASEAKAKKIPASKVKKVTTSSGLPVLSHVYTFLLALTNPENEGKVFYGPVDDAIAAKDLRSAVGFRYMLLDPAHHFKELVEDARAVVLAGGTMEPMTDYTNHLFPYLPPEKLRTVSCGHVIPKENMLAMTVPSSAAGRDFEFTFERRLDPRLINELGRTILNLCSVIPHGIVAFFPSYSYLEAVVNVWDAHAGRQLDGTTKSLYDSMKSKKAVFVEQKWSSSVDEILREYARAVDSGKGALLLSVVGGKMSEGINFSDNLGRGVIMVGLPFPNIYSADWKAKMEFVERSMIERSTEGAPDAKMRQAAKAAAQEYYENACMRAVNQSIGRAIRHRNDYAVILLLDRRFARESIWNKLPKWIRDGTTSTAASTSGAVSQREDIPFGTVMRDIAEFFRNKRPAGR
ncbi:ATP-dependent DNA helicase chl1 [Orbilia brochopaga]|uniref:ATP-dependent DNA helicase CHL1 n=1 Tax=Orbilia brochopaga TaxID=3140254 RepID=A0AAV9U4M4_9PEZI